MSGQRGSLFKQMCDAEAVVGLLVGAGYRGRAFLKGSSSYGMVVGREVITARLARALEDAVCSLWRTSQSRLSCGQVGGLECMSTTQRDFRVGFGFASSKRGRRQPGFLGLLWSVMVAIVLNVDWRH